jgi:hypothetical protein
MIADNPYASCLGDREPVAALAETLSAMRRLTAGWLESDFDRSHAPGKWPARTVLLHLAQLEMVVGTRIRLALHGDAEVVQPFNQDPWVEREARTGSGGEALAAWFGLRYLNLGLIRSLTPEERAKEVQHPERGTINLDWMIRMLAGHDLNHLPQFETVAASVRADREAKQKST